MSLRLTTDAIDEKGYIDPRYTCDIDNSSPELRWEDAPPETAGFAILAESMEISNDGGFAHWVVYHIPKDVHHLPTGIPPQDSLPNGIRQGLNGFRKLGYTGPCPPKTAKAMRYRFKIFALRELIEPPPVRATREQILALITPLSLETSEVIGQYQRVLIERTG
ncbi:MAG: YbhB/YbcL family Raf kinase inhibitor-like protein [Methylotenera sp.]|nr:YbhB/YbcL family Raf kinase inhibitor-like protein [Oligoflexia bacterium]